MLYIEVSKDGKSVRVVAKHKGKECEYDPNVQSLKDALENIVGSTGKIEEQPLTESEREVESNG